MADKENPYGKAKKGETASEKKARQVKYYRQQRLDADAKGDLKTSTKIYDKLNAAKYGKSAAGAAKFRKNKSEYEANELTRPKDSKKSMDESKKVVGKLEKARASKSSGKSVAYESKETPTKAAKKSKSA
jgi:hypothetical protein